MIPELGHFSLILALCLAFMLALLPWIGIVQKNKVLIASARPLSVGLCFFIVVAFLCLAFSFTQDDFSLRYVAAHSNSTLSLGYKLSAVWAGHEGSFLLWILILSLWTLAASLSARVTLRSDISAAIVALLGLILFFFCAFLLATSNPFTRYLPHFPLEGKDLNPLLQDPGLIIHPPILFIGYLGFAIPFAFFIACLIFTEIQTSWLKWLRSFTLIAWSFLTLGVALGSWWAYYELGWGGFWFWDPVENASLMPWLTATALIHCLIISIKRNILHGWTLLLGLTTFSLVLLGGFLVRSGLLSSVHAFATDPKRGMILLFLLMLMIGGALVLYLLQGPALLKKEKHLHLEAFSRESLILTTVVIWLVSAGSILLGTLYPLLYETFTHQEISVGFPYFNAVFIPLMIPLLIAIPLGPYTRWGKNQPNEVFKPLRWAFLTSLLITLFVFIIYNLMLKYSISMLFFLGILLGMWVSFGSLQRLITKAKKGGMGAISLGAWGMCLAHFGAGVVVIGISVVSHFEIERELKMAPGQAITLAGHTIVFDHLNTTEGPNTIGYQAQFTIETQGRSVAQLKPEKRIFVAPGLSMSETALDPGFFRDFYIALGEKLSTEEWSVRIYYKPFVRWIWLGALLMALGGIIASLKRK